MDNLRGTLVIHGDKSLINQGISSDTTCLCMGNESIVGQGDLRKAAATENPYTASKNAEIMMVRAISSLTLTFNC